MYKGEEYLHLVWQNTRYAYQLKDGRQSSIYTNSLQTLYALYEIISELSYGHECLNPVIVLNTIIGEIHEYTRTDHNWNFKIDIIIPSDSIEWA